MTLPPPPRRVRLTTMGIVTYAFLTLLVAAMAFGPLISFLVHDRQNETLIERGVLTHFDVAGSRPTRGGQQIVRYVFTTNASAGSGRLQMSGESIVSDEDFATFSDPEKRLVLYDPVDPESSFPVMSRAALMERHILRRQFALWFYPALAAIILTLSAIGICDQRRKLRLFRFGVAAIPAMVRYSKDGLGRSRVDYQFTDADGKLWNERQPINFRVGIGGDFTPFGADAVAFYDTNDPRICTLFLPRLSLFRFAESG